MFSLRTLLVILLFALIAIVGSINGEPGCGGSSPTWEDMHDEQARQSLDNADKFGRITLDCETTGGGGNGANNDRRPSTQLLSTPLKDKWELKKGYGMDEKTKTVAMTMSAPAGKLSNGDTNV
ncbi:unnamed protein product [Arabidopsis arenosa]|uniref:Uncharacterized protein n=1 Tax=Arabidopsis arenosa TaxID=38785 RepID=A0A8S1ZDQ5_ARAAE|nr:unnamed protein product [Arabidopsis arenosa]